MTPQTDLLIESRAEQTAFTVTEISQLIKQTIEGTFSAVRIRGEISNLKIATSGHVYFNLKDEDAVLMSICWKHTFTSLDFKIEDGLEVICSGKLSTYPGRSTYQMIVSKIEVAGEGALLALLEKRKKMLADEGLFDAARKKHIPFLPLTIAVITSPTGAVIRDILHRIQDRFPVHILVWPTLVQGNGAAEQVSQAIYGFNSVKAGDIIPKPDLIIVARGGGSIEDLWAFNEEIVVRAVANSHIPIISAIGHETDTTLIDYVSDLRAPTPTAAAEKAVPVKQDLQDGIAKFGDRLQIALPNLLTAYEAKLKSLSQGLKNITDYVSLKEIKLQRLSAQLEQRLQQILRMRTEQFYHTAKKLNANLIIKDISALQDKSMFLNKRLSTFIVTILEKSHEKLANRTMLLESYHYRKVLERGFAIVKSEDGIITRKAKVGSIASMDIEFFDGTQKVFLAETQSANVKKKSAAVNASSQASMFE